MACRWRGWLALLVLFGVLSSAVVGDTGTNDGATLLEIKKSFRNVENVLYDWTEATGSDYCSWRGVTCDNITFNVVALNLSGLNLDGEIAPAFGNLKGLVSIDLKANRLSGQIPDEIGDCSSLKVLDLSFNNIYGDIPFSISKLKRLESLILKSNQLIGPIPSTLSQIPNLKTLDLAQNKLSGEIPRLIYWNEVLQYLGLRGNNLEGTLSPDMCQLTGLWYFDVKNNSLTGNIPKNVGNCTSFQVLDLSYNQLTGEIPFNIGFLQVATLSLQGNKFTGFIPSVIGLMQALAVLDLSNNLLTGPIPPILGNLTYTEKLYLQGNKLTGPIPPELGNMTRLRYLELNDNNLTGHIPPELGNLTDLFDLNIANNNLQGPIPENLSSCANLISFNAPGNNLNGTIPQAFRNLESMTYLNLSSNNLTGPIPIELSRIGNLDTLFIGNPGLCGYWISSLCHSSHPPERASISKAAILGIALGALVILLMILVAACRPHHPPPFSDGSINKPVNNISPKLVILHMNMALHVYEDIMRMTENLSEKYIIGYGASSTVYKCVLKNCKPVAIKRLYSHCPHNLKEFETELETVGSIKHRNLVSLQGYSLSPSGNLLFYDYMENGSLWDLLHGPTKKKKLDWDSRLRIALGAAQGLAYLHHDCSPRIIHRDVKSSNILLDKDYESHLTDFGIAKSLCVSKTHTSTYVMGTIGYIDPEYARTSRLNEKSDVYSYGVVLLELLTGKKAVDNECNLHQLILSKAATNAVMETVDPDITSTCKDLGEVKKVFQLALLCTKRQPSDRPTMHEVTRVLGCLVQPGPPPKQSPPPLPLPPPPSVPSYIDEYANLKSPNTLTCTASLSTSDAQLFLKFGEVISQNTE
ncbi:LRR receptor-like serine/threonine-protein kinase ER2 isoform X2 [Phoenix dactylifera]|uniref:non-specific serine/threonine protein kinase n=1 Tax=Phoenix dactylifera TaxID=42345 RepID=A0A8B9AFB8_PHODC|nr:LRR receptor-like serine/threonine-protein kinase ER2 isoform X2 [Phoenix dactylifera]